jgi:putative ABC transport system ATP-binding protein
VLSVEAITKRFGERTVLNAVSLALAPGDFVAITGESGVGKSTLLNVIAGLEPVDAGTVRFEGRDLASLDDDALARLRRDRFGFVFQAFHVLPHLTVVQNVSLPLLLRQADGAEMVAKARAQLAAVGLGGREQGMPRELSGGELQRVAIARALVHRPRLVLADEPTGNLDPRTATDVLQLLRERILEAGGAGILITHSRAVADTADRAYALDGRTLTPLEPRAPQLVR